MVASSKPQRVRNSPKRLQDENNNKYAASQIQKAKIKHNLQAVIAAIKAEMDAEAAADERDADEPVADAAPVVADDGGYDSDGYDLNTYQGWPGRSSHCGMRHDGTCPYCVDDCNGR